MTCYHPCKAFQTGGITENGKPEYFFTSHPGDFIPDQEYAKRTGKHLQPNEYTRIIGGRLALVSYVPVSCGKCIGCRLDYSRRWAVRCCLEASYHECSYFVTLTYDDQHIPNDVGTCQKRLQDFHKRLRKGIGKFRYLACTERGTRSGRLHHHAIYFGLPLQDLVIHSIKDGYTYYTSRTLSRIWGNGHALIGECTYKTCAYVARYCLKNIYSKESKVVMSRKPGLGLMYYNDHFKEIYKTDRIYFDFGDFHSTQPPRYFNDKFKLDNPERAEFLKEIRALNSEYAINNYSNAHGIASGDSLEHQEYTKLDQIRRLKRKL